MSKPLDQQTWEIVCKMEIPLWTVHDLLTAIGLIAPELEGDEAAAALQRLVTLSQDAWKQVEEMRGELFHLNHPRRSEPEVIKVREARQ